MTANTKLTLSNGMEFMYIPKGEFIMGSSLNNKSAGSNEKPQNVINISYDYWMARFLVTNEFYSIYVKRKGIKYPVDDWLQKETHPVVYVTWDDVVAYIYWLNRTLEGEIPFIDYELRLPTEPEWEKAARGTDGRTYPWGNHFEKNNCNSIENDINGTSSVGLYSPSGDSPYGCTDMAGNVWEWTNSFEEEYPYKSENEKLTANRVAYNKFNHIIRGGSYVDSSWYVRCTTRHGYQGSGKGLGFRLAIAPKLKALD